MSKDKAPSDKYIRILDKFNLPADFDFTKKEKKILKYLDKNGEQDILALGDALDFKPGKTRKLVKRLVKMGAANVDGNLVSVSAVALHYLHSEKQERKSSERFYRFLDTLTEKELDEFLTLVSSFEIVPGTLEEVLAGANKEEEKAEEAKPEEPKEEPVKKPAPRRRAPAKKPAVEGEAKPAAKKRTPRKPAAKKPEEEPVVLEDKKGEDNE